jgi:hypothetical protein
MSIKLNLENTHQRMRHCAGITGNFVSFTISTDIKSLIITTWRGTHEVQVYTDDVNLRMKAPIKYRDTKVLLQLVRGLV